MGWVFEEFQFPTTVGGSFVADGDASSFLCEEKGVEEVAGVKR